MRIAKLIIKILFVASIAFFAVVFFYRNSLPDQLEILEHLEQEPIQTELELEPFSMTKEGYTTTVTPLYSYELSGLVVSQYDTDTWYDYYHELDPFNTNDICVVFGENIETGTYLTGKYKSDEYVCYWNFKSWEDYQNFSNSAISNNHLLPATDELAKQIKKTKVGDQVHLKGYLATYEISEEGKNQVIYTRGTSMTREDTGNNSCETIYVTDFEIQKRNTQFFPLVYAYAKYVMMALGVLFLIQFFL